MLAPRKRCSKRHNPPNLSLPGPLGLSHDSRDYLLMSTYDFIHPILDLLRDLVTIFYVPS